MSRMRRAPRGLTLLELVVVLAIVGILSGVAATSIPKRTPTPDSLDAVAGVRRAALSTGRAQYAIVVRDGRAWAISALPDGSVIGDTVFGIERYAGRRLRDARP